MLAVTSFTACDDSSAPDDRNSASLALDEDGDGLDDDLEATFGTEVGEFDTDGDGLSDGREVLELGTNPLVADTDGGGVSDGDEVANGTNPFWADDDHGVPHCFGQCEDGNPCTEDDCDDADGSCTHVPLADGEPCTGGGTCQAGVCSFPSCRPEWCEDGNPCTRDFCDGGDFGRCAHEPVNDGDVCHETGRCVAGVCDYQVAATYCHEGQCDDGNICTRDICDPANGNCSWAPENDRGPCGDGGLCFGGLCLDIEPTDPDFPGADECPAGGAAPPTDGCAGADDGAPCGNGQVCQGGACVTLSCTAETLGESCGYRKLCVLWPLPDPWESSDRYYPSDDDDDGVDETAAEAAPPAGRTPTCVESWQAYTCDPPLPEAGPGVDPEDLEVPDTVCWPDHCNRAMCQFPDGGPAFDGCEDYELPSGEVAQKCVYDGEGSGESAAPASLNEGGAEICDGLDNNGDGRIDEGTLDSDGDGVLDPGTSVCPHPVHQLGGPAFAGGHAYMFVDRHMTWDAAEAYCACFGYDLLALDTPAEAMWVHELVWNSEDNHGYMNSQTWIGARALAPGAWRWDGSGDPLGYEDWSGRVSGDAANTAVHGACALFGQWDDQSWDVDPCNYYHAFVCEAGSDPDDPDPAPETPPDYMKGDCLFDYDGNENFGAGYSICAYLEARLPTSPDDLSARLEAYGDARAFLFVFGLENSIRFHAWASSDEPAFSAGAGLSFTAFGADLPSPPDFSVDAAFSQTLYEMEKTFVQARATYVVGIVPISLTGKATGSIGLDLNGAAHWADRGPGVTLGLTPWFDIAGTAELSTGIPGIFDIGIGAGLTLIRFDVPATVQGALPSVHEIDWAVTVELGIETLSGSIYFFIELLSGLYKYTLTLFEWTGFRWEFTLYEESGTIHLN